MRHHRRQLLCAAPFTVESQHTTPLDNSMTQSIQHSIPTHITAWSIRSSIHPSIPTSLPPVLPPSSTPIALITLSKHSGTNTLTYKGFTSTLQPLTKYICSHNIQQNNLGLQTCHHNQWFKEVFFNLHFSHI